MRHGTSALFNDSRLHIAPPRMVLPHIGPQQGKSCLMRECSPLCRKNRYLSHKFYQTTQQITGLPPITYGLGPSSPALYNTTFCPLAPCSRCPPKLSTPTPHYGALPSRNSTPDDSWLLRKPTGQRIPRSDPLAVGRRFVRGDVSLRMRFWRWWRFLSRGLTWSCGWGEGVADAHLCEYQCCGSYYGAGAGY